MLTPRDYQLGLLFVTVSTVAWIWHTFFHVVYSQRRGAAVPA